MTTLFNSSVPSVVEDRLPVAPRLREAELHRLWLEQRFPPGALTTAAGEPVRVLYRGRPGGGAGPDFRDARISLGGRPPVLGDVELHVVAEDFRRHGHADDPAYARVALHVVLDATGQTATTLPGGGSAPILALQPWVERRAGEIQEWLERGTPWREPCHTAATRLGDERVTTFLAAEGERRLRLKAASLREELTGDPGEHDLYRAICGALGLARNVEPFRLLAERLPLTELLADVAALDDSEAEARVRARLLAAAAFGPHAPALGGLPWRLDGLRPAAHPRRRIEGLTPLIVRHRRDGLAEALRRAAGAGASASLAALQAPGIGRDRAVEVAVNAVIPFLIATGDEGTALMLAASLPPAAAYGRLSLLDAALTSVDAGSGSARPLTRRSALMQQGALTLDREWCRRGGCGVCPLS